MDSIKGIGIYTDDIPDAFRLAAHKGGVLAVDIETRSDTHVPQDALVFDLAHVSLITVHNPDLNATALLRTHVEGRAENTHFPNLVDLLMADEVRKIFHHALFDLRFLYYHYDIFARNVACTKVQEKILHYGAAGGSGKYSLKHLADHYLGVQLEKETATSNWDAPDLEPGQEQYADNDVRYLFPIYQAQRAAMSSRRIRITEGAFGFLPSRAALEVDDKTTDIFSY